MTEPAITNGTNGATPPGAVVPAGDPGASVDLNTVLQAVHTLTEQAKRNDGRITEIAKDVARARQKGVLPGADATASPAERAPATQDDITAAFSLGRIMGTLPAPAQEHIAQLASDGVSFSEQVRIAKAMQIAASGLDNGSGSGDAAIAARAIQPPPPGHAAIAASRTAPPRPRTQLEYAELATKDRPRFEALKNDPTFDATTLPYNR